MINESLIDSTLNEIFDKIEFTAEPAGLYDPLRYMIGIGGKRIRPRLCLLAYSLFQDTFGEEITGPASALEVFHSFTLIHDDIMDKADVRRGVPTVHCKWDDNTAILSGDVMSIESYRRIAKAPYRVLPRILELFSSTAAQVCEGQQYDMDFETMQDVGMDEYMKMIGLKTAVLIACSAKMGAIIGGAEWNMCDLLYQYGYDLGLAFQIADDYLDAFGDMNVFGKKIGGDIINGKKSWLLITAFEKADDAEKEALRKALDMPSGTEEEQEAKIDAVKSLYIKLHVDEAARNAVSELHARAMDSAEQLNLGKVKYEMLHRYANSLLGRTK